MRRLLLAVALAFAAAPAPADYVADLAQRLIIQSGHDCDTVDDMRGAGVVDGSGDAILAVSCDGGEEHALRIHPDDSLTYMARCHVLEAEVRGRFRCFP